MRRPPAPAPAPADRRSPGGGCTVRAARADSSNTTAREVERVQEDPADASQPTPSRWDGRDELGVLANVTRAIVRRYKEQFGRGPTKARTDWAGPNALVCTLENTFTSAEHNLIELGEHERVREMRTFFQYATVRAVCEPVERRTGRTVRGFLSAIDTRADGLAMEAFLLYAEGQDGPSRAEAEDPDPSA